LDILKEAERRKADGGGDGDVEMADETGQPSPSLGHFDILVDNAIHHFGRSPRDVYRGIFWFTDMLVRHERALYGLGCVELRSLVKKFVVDRELDVSSDHLVEVRPFPNTTLLDRWEVDFKSAYIGKKVVQAMRSVEDKHLWESYDEFHRFSDSDALAGWMFEALIHKRLIRGWRESDGALPEPTLMSSNGEPSPAFEYSPSASPPPPDVPRPLRTNRRNVTRVDLTGTLDDVTLAENEYYIPTVTKNPLFDSFAIDHDPGKSVTISIFQVSAAQQHQGSALGYEHIKKIRHHVEGLLAKDESGPTTKTVVTYFILCPKDKAKLPGTWKMPRGWKMNSGDVFCVPISTSRTPCSPTPNFSA